MKIDNIEQIRKILGFAKFGEFYYISIMQQNKDGVKVASSHDNCRRIRTFYIFSMEEFDKAIPFIKEICDKINARAYIELNRKDIFQCQLLCIKKLVECIEHQTVKSRAIMDSVVGGAPSRDKYWMVDIDNKDDKTMLQVFDHIHSNKGSVIATLPTLNGRHMICSRFDNRYFNFKDCEIKRNAFTLLYYNYEVLPSKI